MASFVAHKKIILALKLSSLVIALTQCLLLTPLAHAETNLSTIAEQSGFQKTGRYDEVVRLCDSFQKTYPRFVRCYKFGTTPEGRPMLALLASRTGVLGPLVAQQRKLPVVLVQGGIHAGEIDGKDAGFLALRELLENPNEKNALDEQVLLFVPVFNIDGHERFGRWNRPNQRGPEEMGWRTTSQNFNLNRDYVKADTPEMQAMLKFINEWDPLATIDLHVTDGAKFEHDISIQVEPSHIGDSELQKAGASLRDTVVADLAQQGSLPLPFYMAFEETDNPLSGFVDGAPTPRFSSGYFVLRNRFAMLVETHSWKDYATRVKITHNAVMAVLRQVAEHGKEWRKMALEADQRSSSLAGKVLPITYKTTEKTKPIAFRGYAYTRTMSEISGGLMTHYDENTPQIWNVTLRDKIIPDKSAIAPQGGYVVPAGFANAVAEKLRLHGIRFHVLSKPWDKTKVEEFHSDKISFSAKPFESHQMLTLHGEWQAMTKNLTAGSLYVPIAQSKARLIAALFEPDASDALVRWGWFNNAFERKEYLEAYVTEDVARAQLAADPALKAAFEAKLANDPAFAKSPAARLEFFERRHASWDDRFEKYPVLRVATPLF